MVGERGRPPVSHAPEIEGIDSRCQPKPDKQCADRIAIARARCRQSPTDRRPQGIGYQTLLKMLVHEGLRPEARRR